jgi:hypothetical protein
MTFRQFLEYGTPTKVTTFGGAGRLGQSQATPEKFVKPVIPRPGLKVKKFSSPNSFMA